MERKEPKLEIREKPIEREVVRIFLMQSETPQKFSQKWERAREENPEADEAAFAAEASFTDTIWALKKHPGSKEMYLIPIGGSKKFPGEMAEEAAKRKMLAETHLRTSTDIQMVGQQSYEYHHPDKGQDMKDDIEYCSATVSPSDVAFALNPEMHHFSTFTLSYNQTQELLQNGHLRVEGQEYRLGNALQAEGWAPDNAKHEFSMQLKIQEATKKADMLAKLYRLRFHGEPEAAQKAERGNILRVRELHAKLTSAQKEDPEAAADQIINIEFPEFIKRNKINTTDLAKALKFSDLEEEVASAGLNYPETWLRITAIESPNLLNLDDLTFKTLNKNKDIRNFFHRLSAFSKKLEPEEEHIGRALESIGEFESDPAAERRLCLHFVQEVLQHKFEKGTLTKTKEAESQKMVSSALDLTDDLLNEIAKQAAKTEIGSKLQLQALEQLNEIEDIKSLNKLIRYALGTHPDLADYTDPEARKQAVFEARRKFVLTILAYQVNEFYDAVKRNGIEPIKNLWSDGIISPPKKNEESGQFYREVNVFPSRRAKKTVAVPAQVYTSPKERKEVFRKTIVRNQDPKNIKDIYRRTICLEPTDPSLLERVPIKTPKGPKTEYKIVLDLMDTIIKKAAYGHEGTTTIWNFKPTPEADEPIESLGPGGDFALNYAKFYLVHASLGPDGEEIKRYEEVQIFVPSEGKTANQKYLEKKADDERYGIDRLFDTKSIRSAMELLNPANIKGEIVRKVTAKAVRGKKKK